MIQTALKLFIAAIFTLLSFNAMADSPKKTLGTTKSVISTEAEIYNIEQIDLLKDGKYKNGDAISNEDFLLLVALDPINFGDLESADADVEVMESDIQSIDALLSEVDADLNEIEKKFNKK